MIGTSVTKELIYLVFLSLILNFSLILIYSIYETNRKNFQMLLTHLMPLVSFYAFWKQETCGFLTFSEGIERKYWAVMG